MGTPNFNSFDLNDSTYITETVEHRTRATRRLESESISRRGGKVLLSSQIQEKIIEIAGHIIATTPSGLQSAVDNLHKNVSSIEGDLIVESGRTYRATAERIRIPDRTYSQTMLEFSIQFVCSRPYSEGSNQISNFSVASGINSYTLSTTISGSAPNRPIFNFTLPSGTGTSPVKRIDIQYSDTGNQVTVSGNYSAESAVVLNYNQYLVTVAGTNDDFIGQMDEIQPGSAVFILTISGKNDGIRSSLEYSPRYW